MKYDIKTIRPKTIAAQPARIPRNLMPYKLLSVFLKLLIKTIVPEYNNRMLPNKLNSFVSHADMQIIKSTKPIAIRKNNKGILFIFRVSNNI